MDGQPFAGFSRPRPTGDINPHALISPMAGWSAAREQAADRRIAEFYRSTALSPRAADVACRSVVEAVQSEAPVLPPSYEQQSGRVVHAVGHSATRHPHVAVVELVPDSVIL